MNAPDYLRLLDLTGAEAILAVAALVTLFVDLTLLRGQPREVRRGIATLIGLVGCVAGGLHLVLAAVDGATLGGLFLSDPVARAARLGVLLLTALTLVLALEWDVTEHIGELHALLQLAAVGMLLMAGAGDLLMVFLALELTGLSLYALVALDRSNPAGTEAALKYFFFGGTAAAFTILGFSLLYGLTGTTQLAGVARQLGAGAGDPLLAAAIVLVLTGLGFKVAAVPFHLWAPDAYQGAPTPVAALIASGSKLAGFFLLVRVVSLGLPGAAGSAGWGSFSPGWAPVLAVLAFASLLLGNLAALAQRDLKRLLAYSAIAHGGHMLLGVLAVPGGATSTGALAAVLFYATTYGLTAIAAFAVAGYLERTRGTAGIAGLAGLARQSPWFAGGLLVAMLSLAGLPPFAGFPAKFLVFAAVLRGEAVPTALLWLVATALLLSPVALYYYLKVLKQAWVVLPEGAEAVWPPPTRSELLVVVGVALALTALGIYPDWLLDALTAAARGGG